MPEGSGPALAGHALIEDGGPHNVAGRRISGRVGMGRCECGAQSQLVGTKAERKRWHRAHKQEGVGHGV